MSDLVRVHCPNCGRTCARVYVEDGVEYWETRHKTIPYDKFRRSAWVSCPNYDRSDLADAIWDPESCHTLWSVEPRHVLEKVQEARMHGLKHMPTGYGVGITG